MALFLTATPPDRPLVVLLVGTDAGDRQTLRRHLQLFEPAIEIDEAANGGEATDRLAIRCYDGVFLDHRLPDMDGIALLRRHYDADSDRLPAPFIMLIDQSDEGAMAEALRWGAHEYLVKGALTADGVRMSLAKARELFELRQARRKAGEMLRQAQRMEAVGQLASGVAHDFDSLMTLVLGNTRLLQKQLAGDGEIDRADLAAKIAAIDQAARRGTDLARRLTAFARQAVLREDVVDIDGCLRDICPLLQRALGQLARVECVFGAENWPVRIDRSRLENALVGIAVTARDAMPEGGVLTVATGTVTVDDDYLHRHPSLTPGDYVVIAISGIGAPAAGASLAMFHDFARQSGGHVQVHNDADTVIRLYVPSVGVARDDAPAPSAPEDGTATILVVEDDPEVRLVARTMLERLGYSVMAAESGPVALELLKREHRRIDLLFTDIVMPGGLSGAELVREAQRQYPGLRALYTSGYTENAIPGYQLIAGEELLGKPYRKEALAKKVREALRTRPPAIVSEPARRVDQKPAA